MHIILIHDSYYNTHFINSFFFSIPHFLKVYLHSEDGYSKSLVCKYRLFLGQGNVTISEIILKFKHFYSKKRIVHLNKKYIIII